MRRILGSLLAALVIVTAGCDDDAFSVPDCLVVISVPTEAPTWSTAETAIVVGGAAGGASYVRIRNADTGFDDWTAVIYSGPGAGSWAFHDGLALVEGPNRLIVTAHRNGIDEAACSQDTLVVTRTPLP